MSAGFANNLSPKPQSISEGSTLMFQPVRGQFRVIRRSKKSTINPI